MPKDRSIHKVLVIGSGPIVIGQAAEFDYAGAQACRILRQEGIESVLVNSNPATIMTDKKLADAIYLEPLTPETLRRIIAKERPDGLLAGLGGQTGLTLAMQLSRDGTLQKYGVRLLGSDIESIERAEDNTFTIIIQHTPYMTIYRHVARPLKAQGALVEAGEAVGQMDGQLDLEMEIWNAGEFVNPEEAIVW